MKHNNQVPNNHFRKHWQVNVKTWFDQPARKQRRRNARLQKAARISPRPVDGVLRAAVHCPTIKYNSKVRLGRGFSLSEIKAAKLNRVFARSVGIAVDHRRRSHSDINVARLEMYKAKLVIYNKPCKGKEAIPIEQVPQLAKGQLLPLSANRSVEAPRAITKEESEFSAYQQRRKEGLQRRIAGKLAKKAAEESAEKDSARK